MAVRRALIRDPADGRMKELPIGDTLAGVLGGTSLKGVATITVPGPLGFQEWTETVAAAGITTSHLIIAALAPTTETDENETDMLDVQSIVALSLVDQILFSVTFATNTSGRIKLNWSAF